MMLRKSFATIAVALLLSVLCGRAMAGGYTVYIHNITNGAYTDGTKWQRTGFTHDLYTSFDACWDSVVDRILENWYYGTNNEAFAIIWTESRPGWGCYCRQYIQGTPRVELLTYPTGSNGVWLYYSGGWHGPYYGN